MDPSPWIFKTRHFWCKERFWTGICSKEWFPRTETSGFKPRGSWSPGVNAGCFIHSFILLDPEISWVCYEIILQIFCVVKLKGFLFHCLQFQAEFWSCFVVPGSFTGAPVIDFCLRWWRGWKQTKGVGTAWFSSFWDKNMGFFLR